MAYHNRRARANTRFNSTFSPKYEVPALVPCPVCKKNQVTPGPLTRCEECSRFSWAITNEKTPPLNLINPKMMLQVTFDIKTKSHDGYCSDSYNVETTRKDSVMVLPLHVSFTREDFDKNDKVDLSNPKLTLYEMNTVTGWCGCGDTYRIIEAMLVEKRKPLRDQL